MTNPTDLLDAIVDSLQDIPALVTLMGGADRITAYSHQWPTSTSWMLALHNLKPLPSILMIFRGTSNARWGGIPSRAHDFSLLIREGGNVSAMAISAAIMNGLPTAGGGLRWASASIHADVDMVQVPELYLRTLQVTETAFLDYHEVQFALSEKFAA